ncbi:MAG: regulatory protein RecX [bacterium]|nr:regulatory protein RecX [bacterium]
MAPETTKPRKPRRLEASQLEGYAARLLAARAYSVAELRDKLRRKAAARADVNPLIKRLTEARALDDERYAEAYASSRLENQGHGRSRVLRDLRQHRVPAAVAERAVGAVFDDTDETELVEAFLARKYRNVVLPEFLAEARNLASAYRRLRYAGFSSGASIAVLKRHSEQAEQLESIEGDEEA